MFFTFNRRGSSSLTHISETKTQAFLCIFDLSQNVRAWLCPASQKCLCGNGGSCNVGCIKLSLGKEHGYTLSMYMALRLLWAEGDTVVTFYFFFPFVLICMEFLTTETVSNTLSMKLFKQFKHPLHATPSCCGRGKPQQSDQKEKRTMSRCPDWAGHCFSPSDALQKSSGYQQFTTFLVDFHEILKQYNSFSRKKKPG